MIINILNGNIGTEKEAYSFGELLEEELSDNGIKDIEIKYNPYTTGIGNGVTFYGATEENEEIIYTAIEDTFSRM